jgi:hypothetical protein
VGFGVLMKSSEGVEEFEWLYGLTLSSATRRALEITISPLCVVHNTRYSMARVL